MKKGTLLGLLGMSLLASTSLQSGKHKEPDPNAGEDEEARIRRKMKEKAQRRK